MADQSPTNAVTVNDQPVTVQETALTRDQIRAAVLGTPHKPRSKIITFFDSKIEIRQGTLGDIIQANDTEDRKAAIIRILIERAFVPGTNINVFEDADEQVLLNLPFGKDFIEVNRAIEEISEVNFLDRGPTSGSTQ